ADLASRGFSIDRIGIMSEGLMERLDDRVRGLIWRGMGVESARETAEKVGMKPDEVLRIRKELLDSVDALTVQQKRQKLIVDLQDIAQRVQEDYDSAPWEFKAGLMNSGISAMKTVLVELNRTAKGEQEAVDRLNELRVRELLRLIDVSVSKTFTVL